MFSECRYFQSLKLGPNMSELATINLFNYWKLEYQMRNRRKIAGEKIGGINK